MIYLFVSFSQTILVICMFAGCPKDHRVDEQGSCLNLHHMFEEEFISLHPMFSQTKIYILLEAAEHADVLLQKDSDLVELRDANASLERKVSWFFLYQHFGSSLLQFPFINNSGQEDEATI